MNKEQKQEFQTYMDGLQLDLKNVYDVLGEANEKIKEAFKLLSDEPKGEDKF